MPEMIDTTARAQIAAHEKFCVERESNAKVFEADVKLYLTSLNGKIDHLVSGYHKSIRALGYAMIVALGTGLIGLIIYIWDHK